MHYLAIGGGLGNIINQCYLTTYYVALDGITQRTIILFACHHKFAREIFTQHPKHDLFDILEGRYFGDSTQKLAKGPHRADIDKCAWDHAFIEHGHSQRAQRATTGGIHRGIA